MAEEKANSREYQKFANLRVNRIDRERKDPYFTFYINGKPRHFVSQLSIIPELIEEGVFDAENIISLTAGRLSQEGDEWTFTYDREEAPVIMRRDTGLGNIDQDPLKMVRETVGKYHEVDPFVLILMDSRNMNKN